MPDTNITAGSPLGAAKFHDPEVTAKGEPRAFVELGRLKTLWFNTGSLCNIACDNCYIESSPTNDRLAYLAAGDVLDYLDEIEREAMSVEEIAFTGGEPFMNQDLPAMLAEALGRGYRVLVLTNAMKPMLNHRDRLMGLRPHGSALALRVSIDHYGRELHEQMRGEGTWQPMLEGLRWLAASGFNITAAARTCWPEDEASLRLGFAKLFAAENIAVDADDAAQLLLFPEMDMAADVPEITVNCWRILNVDPGTMMCASSRMIVKRKGSSKPVVLPCTLLPYDRAFELGARLADAATTVKLNHPFCAQFCVLGGASCSGA